MEPIDMSATYSDAQAEACGIWRASDTSMPVETRQHEFKDQDGEWHTFDIIATSTRIVFGCASNGVFLESGYISRLPGETLADTFADLIADLETYYVDGPRYCQRIATNERM